MPALEPTHTSTAPESIAFGIEGYRTRNLGRVVDAMYAPATTFDAWSKRLASTAAQVFEGSLEVSVASTAGRSGLRIDDSSKTLRISGDVADNACVVMSIGYERGRRLFRNERARLLRIALHLENAAFLKITRQVRGTVGWNDRVLVLNDRAPHELWGDLAQGRASLASTDLNASRYFILDAPLSWARHRALTELEANVVRLAAAGRQFKSVADEVRMSAPSVSRALSVAAAKIGVRGTCELLRIAARLTPTSANDQRALVDEELTAAEQEVLALVVAGHSNRAIAALRGRSTRTIANQVGSLLLKTGCASRHVLATRHRS